MKIKLGASPLSWMNSDIPSLGSHISIEQCLSELALMGYQGFELEDPFRKILPKLPHMIASRKLSCIGGWHSTFLLENSIQDEIKRLKEHMKILSDLMAEVVIVAECSKSVHRQVDAPLSKRPKLSLKEWTILCDKLDQIAQCIHDHGFKSAYHHHMGTVVQSEEDVDNLVSGTEKLGLLFDSGHLLFSGADPMKVLTKHRNRITHVHFKNIRSSKLLMNLQNDLSFPKAVLGGVFTVPGDEFDISKEFKIDFKNIINKLVETDYRGWFVMEAEQDPQQADPFVYANLGYHTLNAHLVQGQFHFNPRLSAIRKIQKGGF